MRGSLTYRWNLVKKPKQLSKEAALRIAARPDGFLVHIYKWGSDQKRKQFNRYKREGLVSRERWGDMFIFRTIPATKKDSK